MLEAAGLVIRWAFAAFLVYVWYSTVAFSVISIVCCAFLPHIRRFTTESLWYILHPPSRLVMFELIAVFIENSLEDWIS